MMWTLLEQLALSKVNIYGLLTLLLIIMNAIVLFFVFFCL